MIPSAEDAAFVSAMEDVLDVYCRPYDPLRPVVCLDESPKELRAHVRPPLSVEPGKPPRIDDHYQRHGTRNLFIACEPLRGWREIKVTDRASPAWQPYEPELGTGEDGLKGGRRWDLTVGAGQKQKLSCEYTIAISAKHEIAGGNRREA